MKIGLIFLIVFVLIAVLLRSVRNPSKKDGPN
jgi:hypothetical protein